LRVEKFGREHLEGRSVVKGLLRVSRESESHLSESTRHGSYAMHRSRSHDAVIRVNDAAGNVIETHEHAGDFKEL